MPESAFVRLEPMSEKTFAAYIEHVIVGYAHEHAAHGRWTQEEALARAREETASLLPEGLATPGHAIFDVVLVATGEKVGALWLAVHRSEGVETAFVYNIEIDPPHRRKGYGEAAMLAAEEKAAALGQSRIGLHVFGTNEGAIALYEKIGYRPMNIVMAKTLRP